MPAIRVFCNSARWVANVGKGKSSRTISPISLPLSRKRVAALSNSAICDSVRCTSQRSGAAAMSLPSQALGVSSTGGGGGFVEAVVITP